MAGLGSLLPTMATSEETEKSKLRMKKEKRKKFNGRDVSKELVKFILRSSHFHSIPLAVMLGRKNRKKVQNFKAENPGSNPH